MKINFKNRKIILIDQSWLLYKFHYSIGGHKIEVKDHLYAVGIVSQFTKLVSEIISSYGRDILIIFCADRGDGGRKKIEKSYKIQRKSNKEIKDILPDIEKILSILPKQNILFAYAEKFEADDVIAFLAYKFKKLNNEIIIFSSDKDFWQLYSDGINIATKWKNKKFEFIDENTIFSHKDFKIEPKYLLRYRILIGDPSDNISPVVPRMRKDHFRKFAKIWYHEKNFFNAIKIFEKTNKKSADKLLKAYPEIKKNLQLINLKKYKLKDFEIPVKFKSIKPELNFIDFYNLNSFKFFLKCFFEE